MEAFFELYVQGSRIVQVMAFAPHGRFAAASADLRQIVASLILL
jgi:hypothetical protein